MVGEAARFETPLRWAPGGAEPRSFFSVDDPNLVLDTVKRAEDSDALVLRLYEAHGARGTARLRVGVPFTDASSCNLLEDPGEPLETDGDEIVIRLPAARDRERAGRVNHRGQGPKGRDPSGFARAQTIAAPVSGSKK